ncbi:uncharacterized protein B0J16DRAFT_322123 [Fusarium flagelliforme]|uniref:uncharacterized protein n=1 Tax=Fusarium flagelliforme TaxID=2675880 RepID=UPI001E8E3AA9|nr:uncharacterized protein B0J16DRAFT_322123 [Fusarium flagelliforme]KAH7183389.1 hypothetical protein B0J16DRAFT_322123 [Fusarium flagelliforme]
MSTPSSGGTFPFLAFPPELRNRIYRFCSPQNTCFIIGGGSCMRAPDEEGDIQAISESRKEIRHMVLFLDWDNLHFCLPRQEDRYIETWAELLSGLSTLHLIVGPSPRPGCYPNGWPELLKKHLEFIDQHIPPHLEVVVDTDGEESTNQLVDETISNHCTFEQLAAGDGVFKRGKL